MDRTDIEIPQDLDTVSRIAIVPAILELICRSTGMGFAAVAKVTSERWVAMAVRDEIQFGLRPGGELKVDTTICHEIQQSGKEVVIDHVEKDEFYHNHHTPAMYGFQSYFSIPITRNGGRFFGTLCAIDPRPAILNTSEIINMFKVYSDLISFHLNAVELLPGNEVKVLEEHSIANIQKQLMAEIEKDLNNQVADAQLSKGTIQDRHSKEFKNKVQVSADRISALLNDLKMLSQPV